MKKIIILAIAIVFFNTAFSQNHNDHNRSNEPYRSAPAMNKTNDHGWQSHDRQNQYSDNNRTYNGRNRQAEIDRVNRDYDQRIYNYRHDRAINRYEREKRIRQAESERATRLKSFGTGALVGAVAGLVLGALISH